MIQGDSLIEGLQLIIINHGIIYQIYQKEEAVQEDWRSDGRTHFLQETDYHPNKNKEEGIERNLASPYLGRCGGNCVTDDAETGFLPPGDIGRHHASL
jgi:hypothetical protein